MIRLKYIPVLVLMLFLSCKTDKEPADRIISKVEIRTVISDSNLNIRALEILKNNKGAAFLTSNGELGSFFKIDMEDLPKRGKEYLITPLKPIVYDSIRPNFRALALTSNGGFGISIGNPALLFDLGEDSEKLVYKEEDEKVFYDSMEFWNENEGIAIGDAMDGCMSILITRDGGLSWKKLDCSKLPAALEGEGAFAASDTNIAIYGNAVWVATGGKASRILFSENKGESWEVFDTPMVGGKETTGIYSIDFYDDKNGFAIGGDYTSPDLNEANKIITSDGGRSWRLIEGGPGYRSCVQYIPNGNGNELVAVGFEGIDYSNDAGLTWKHLSNEGFYTIRFLNDSTAFAAGKGRVSKLTFK